MFRAAMCPSSGELYQYDIWYMSLCIDDRLVCRFRWDWFGRVEVGVYWGGGTLRWEYTEVGVYWGGSMLRWEYTEVGVYWSGSILRWEYTEVGVCWGGSILRWEYTEVGVCWDGSILRWEYIEVGVYWGGSILPPQPGRTSLIQTCTPDGHLCSVTYTRCHIDTINSPDDGHMAARNM